MQNAKGYALELRESWLKESLSELIVESFEKDQNEGYYAHVLAGSIHLKAFTPTSTIFALNQLKIGLKSGHLSDFIGTIKPRFNLRPLWPKSYGFLDDQQKLNFYCQRTIDLGFNAIVFKEVLTDAFYETLQGYGIKVIFHPGLLKTHCPADPMFKNELEERVKESSNFDYLFWQSHVAEDDFFNHSDAFDDTIKDLVLKELRLVEQKLNSSKSLIFYIPSQDLEQAKSHSKWMESFCDDVGDKTLIAFSAVSGDPDQDCNPPHPFWEVLRKSPDTSATPLMTILNTGALNQGEGRWPLLTTDLIDHYISHLHRHHFAGAIAMIPNLPKKGSLLDCSLWSFSQALWGTLSSSEAIQTWFLAYRPELNYFECFQFMRKARLLALEFLQEQNILDQIHKLKHDGLSDYVACFSHDVKQFMQGDKNQLTFAKDDHNEKSLKKIKKEVDLFT